MDDILDGSADAIRKAAWPPDGNVYDECGPFTNDPEEKKAFLRILEEVRPKDSILRGTVTMYGTSGNMDVCNFKDLFYKSNLNNMGIYIESKKDKASLFRNSVKLVNTGDVLPEGYKRVYIPKHKCIVYVKITESDEDAIKRITAKLNNRIDYGKDTSEDL
jgi:hypothetical protein